MLRGARVVYVATSGAASFSLPTASRTPLSFHFRQPLRRLASTTSTTPAASSSSSTSTASTAAGAAAEVNASASPKESFFKSDSWTKTVGTIGALANWSIPLAAITAIYNKKDPATIDPIMTTSLAIYSALFMRWAIAISPPNYPLLFCHICNEAAQLTQLGRYAMADKSGPPKPKEPALID